jgi:lysozyme
MTDYKQFDENWRGAKSSNLIRELYYYRPNENSLEQAAPLLKRFLKERDLPPVLDIERLPENRGPLESRIKRWLIAVEAHYKVKPIIYTGERYYDDF